MYRLAKVGGLTYFIPPSVKWSFRGYIVFRLSVIPYIFRGICWITYEAVARFRSN